MNKSSQPTRSVVVRAALATLACAVSVSAQAAEPRCFEHFEPAITPAPRESYLEIQRLHWMTDLRTPGRVEAIKAQWSDPSPLFWQLAKRNPADHPDAAKRLLAAQNELGEMVLAIKERINRPRAAAVDGSLKTVVQTPWHKSYPSGHSAQAFLTALMFGQAMPDQADAFLKLAAQIALNREVAGVHYASDTQAGYDLAAQAFKALAPACRITATEMAAKP